MQLEESVKELWDLCMEMCSLVQNNITQAFHYYENFEKINRPLIIDDDRVDAYERRIESGCLDTIMRERPYATNMRTVSGILKTVEDIERIGDHAEDIATWTKLIKDSGGHTLPSLVEMERTSLDMVEKAFLALARVDEALAFKVEKEDDIQDELYDKSLQQLVKLDSEPNANHQEIIYSTIVAKYYERISDHAVNVAEWAIYILKGYHKDKQIF